MLLRSIAQRSHTLLASHPRILLRTMASSSNLEAAKALLGAYAAPYLQPDAASPASSADFKAYAQSLGASSTQSEVLLGDKKSEKVVQTWLDKAHKLLSQDSASASAEPSSKELKALEKEIEPITFVAPTARQPTAADVGLFAYLSPLLSAAPASTQHAFPALARYASHISQLPEIVAASGKLPQEQQNGTKSWLPVYEGLPKIERIDLAAEKAKAKEAKAKAAAAAAAAAGTAPAAAAAAAEGKNVKKEKAAAAAAPPAEGQDGASKKKEKKEKAAAAGGEAKPKKEKAAGGGGAAKNEPTRPLPSQVDLRVGKIVKVERHPDADSLYLETVDFGEAEGPRTVLSGLVKYCTLEDLQGRLIVGICNLKPVAMRGIKSHAMLLCATSKDGAEGGVEPVTPPAGSVPGDRLWVEGYEALQPDAQLNPKKKVFEAIQPGYLTTADKQAGWKGVGPDEDPATAEPKVRLIRGDKGVVTAARFDGATLS